MTSGARLTADGLSIQFGGLRALGDLSLDVPPQEIRGLIGPNGAGKTTFFNCVTGFYRPTAGALALDGQRIDGLPPNQITRAGVSRTFQNIRLFGGMTSIENVLVGAHHYGRATGDVHPRRHGGVLAVVNRAGRVPRAAGEAVREIVITIGRTAATQRADAATVRFARSLLVAVGLEGRENFVARNLAYGDQRRLELARALATVPRLLLLDEPTAGMNPQESAEMVRLIRRIRDDFQTTIILIEHQMRVVMGVCERITVLDYGQKIAEGTPAEIQRDRRVIEAYLGTRAATGEDDAPA